MSQQPDNNLPAPIEKVSALEAVEQATEERLGDLNSEFEQLQAQLRELNAKTKAMREKNKQSQPPTLDV